MIIESTNLEDYIKKSEVIDYDNKLIVDKCLELKKDTNNEIELIKKIYEFVRDEISHSGDINAEEVTCLASEVLSFGHGICCAKSHLLAAMLRFFAIPTGFCYQILCSRENKKIVHGLNAVYLSNLNKWIRLDARGNKVGVNAQFSIEEEKLAWPIRKGLGERDIETIFKEPNEKVKEVLKKYENRKEFKKHYQPDLKDIFN